eukprot:scaffold1438_cov93-Skeletonema_menzelii.AAC.1
MNSYHTHLGAKSAITHHDYAKPETVHLLSRRFHAIYLLPPWEWLGNGQQGDIIQPNFIGVAASLLASTLSASAFHSSHYIRQGGCKSVLLFRQRACAGDNIIKRFPSKISLSSTSLSNTPTGPSFCEKCGTPIQLQVPEGDERERH